MTQALAFQQWCRRAGHQVVGVLAGAHSSRSWPDFFRTGFETPVERLASPGFVFRRDRSVALPATAWQTLRHAGAYRASLRALDAALARTRPDLVVNFLEPLVGLHRRRRRAGPPVLAVGHQFMLGHPAYPRVPGRPLQQWSLRRYVGLVGHRATRYALSFYEAADQPARGLHVGPPLLRDELFRLPVRRDGRFLLVYLLNHGYRAEIERWHARHPETPLHCFYDRPDAPAEEAVDATLTFHRLHGEKFLRLMAEARAVVCTAGFESVSEAAYLGKPALLVPVQNHVEQYLNALDAQHVGLGRYSPTFALDRLRPEEPGAAHDRFRWWVDQSDARLRRAVTAAARSPGQPETAPAGPAAAPAAA
jgi:uncharacterized protein (TIGR00661 family)